MGKIYNVFIICAHVPIDVSEENDKKIFYDQLKRTYDKNFLEAQKIKLIMLSVRIEKKIVQFFRCKIDKKNK